MKSEVIKMKKFIASLLSFALIFTMAAVPVSASTNETNVIVEYSSDEVAGASEDTLLDNTNRGDALLRAASDSDYDLGDNNSLEMNISDFTAGSTRQSDYNYSTNTTKIKIKMSSDKSVSVRVTLYDSSNNSQIGQQTVTVPSFGSVSVTFTSLTSAKKYYIKYENLGQQTVNITGTISPK